MRVCFTVSTARKRWRKAQARVSRIIARGAANPDGVRGLDMVRLTHAIIRRNRSLDHLNTARRAVSRAFN